MIALFDSGLGGLSVLREVRALMPHHNLAYFADSAFCPYGPRSAEFVRERSLTIGRWLLGQGTQVLVVACNTASSAALEALRAELPIPVVGMEPGLKPAAAASRTGRIGILATSGTLAGQRFHTLVERYAGTIEVVTQPCPGWVEQVEAGELTSEPTRVLVERFVAPLTARGADTLVLGCTHYPFLRPLIAEAAGPHTTLIDTGPAVARQVARVAASLPLPQASLLHGWTTGEPTLYRPMIARLVGIPVSIKQALV